MLNRLAILMAMAGLGLAACGGEVAPEELPPAEEFAFTEADVVRFKELVMGEQAVGLTGAISPLEPHLLVDGPESDLPAEIPVLDLSQLANYNSIRTEAEATDVFKVTNQFVNLRSAPRVTAEQVGRLVKGDVMTVIEFANAAWAKVKLPNSREGYVSTRYIAKVTTEDKLAEDKAEYGGLYFVNFGFLNVRENPDSQSDKLGELPGQAIVKIITKDEVWARVPFEGREGYIAVDYLKPFLPNFLVRQDTYRLPIVHFNLSRPEMLGKLGEHLDGLRSQGLTVLTLKDFKDLLVKQEERDVRLDPNSVVVAISGLSATNLEELTSILRSSNLRATLFVRSNQISINGLTEKDLLSLVAAGHDVQSAGHSGDDLRSLTNAQIELELKQSRQLIEQKTNQPVFSVLYPVGGVNDRVEDIAAAAGYLLGVNNSAATSFKRHQLLRMPSFAVSVSTSKEELKEIWEDG